MEKETLQKKIDPMLCVVCMHGVHVVCVLCTVCGLCILGGFCVCVLFCVSCVLRVRYIVYVVC